MKKWLVNVVCVTTLLGVFGVAGAEQSAYYVAKSGDTLLSRFGKMAAPQVCKLNKLQNCDKIYVGQKLRLPINVRGRDDMMVFSDVTTVKARPEAAQSCITLGAAPWNPDHNLGRTLQGIDLLTTLTPDQRELAKQKVALGEMATKNELVGQQIFTEMLYQSRVGKKEAKHVYGKPICSSEQGGRVEVMDTYALGEGVYLSIPRICGNPSTFYVKPAALPAPRQEPSIEPPAPVAITEPAIPAPELVSEPPEEVEKVAREYDWDASLYVGGDKDVRYAGGEAAGYPYIRYAEWGRYALGGGGTLSLWNGGTPDGYRYSGELPAFGLAQKFSFNNRRDVGLKLMYGDLWERGHDATGKYQASRHANLLCAALNYTDASREKAGEKVVPEWQVWASFCDPFHQSATHSWDGKTIATKPEDVKYVAGVGARLFLTDRLGDSGFLAQVQPFVEVGVNKTAPNPSSGHAYVGLRGIKKVWGIGVEPHWSNLGETLGATLTYDLGRDIKLHIQAERWTAMIKAVEALGVAVD